MNTGMGQTAQQLDINDPKRQWTDIGGDLEASYDGARYVDIRTKGGDPAKATRIFASKEALEKALTLFPTVPEAVEGKSSN